jgi:hypothetical protein
MSFPALFSTSDFDLSLLVTLLVIKPKLKTFHLLLKGKLNEILCNNAM